MPSFLNAYEAWASANTGAPVAFHRFTGLAVLGAALGNRVYIEANWGRIYPALWIGLVGPSDTFKSSASDQGARLMELAQPKALFPHSFSTEAMIEQLAQQPYGFLYWSELGAAFDHLGRDYNTGALSQLTDIFDSKTVTRKTKNAGLVRAERPALSILAAGKLRWFLTKFHLDIDTGFIGRWLFVVEEEPARGWRGMYEQNGRDRSAHFTQQQSLVDHLAMLGQIEGEVRRGKGGEVIDEFCKSLKGKWSDDTDPAEFHARAGAQITKIAIAIQASHVPLDLQELVPEACTQAAELWLYAFERSCKLVDRIMGHGRDSDVIESVSRIVRQEQSITRRELLRRTRMRSRDLEEYVTTLTESGLVGTERTTPDGGGPTTVWLHWRGRSRP